MKKILVGFLMVVLLVACSKSDYGLGDYKEKQYSNKHFNMDFEITDKYANLTSEELKQHNDSVQAASQDPESSKYFNKVMDFSNTNKTSLTAYVDSRPKEYKNSVAEVNKYLDFLTEQGINYELKKGELELNGVKYERADLVLDFGFKQTVLMAVQSDLLINIQINYSADNEKDVDSLLTMLNNNE